MSNRDWGLLLVIVLSTGAWALGRYWKPAAGAAAFVILGLGFVADDYFTGPLPWKWGATGAAMVGFGVARFLYSRQQAASDAHRTSAST